MILRPHWSWPKRCAIFTRAEAGSLPCPTSRVTTHLRAHAWHPPTTGSHRPQAGRPARTATRSCRNPRLPGRWHLARPRSIRHGPRESDPVGHDIAAHIPRPCNRLNGPVRSPPALTLQPGTAQNNSASKTKISVSNDSGGMVDMTMGQPDRLDHQSVFLQRSGNEIDTTTRIDDHAGMITACARPS